VKKLKIQTSVTCGTSSHLNYTNKLKIL